MNIVVLGGYGTFGSRICRALARDGAATLIIAGRDLAKAQALAESLGGSDRGIHAAAIDARELGLASKLAALGARLVIHAAGPFQGQSYAVALACASAGSHYLDLADGRAFVRDFSDAAGPAFAKAKLVAMTGASTVPTLSSSVVDHLIEGWMSVDSIDLCIAPAHGAARGRATLAAVLGYCGEPVKTWQDGGWTDQAGWAHPRLESFARLSPRLGALCEIPDLDLLPERYPGVSRVMFRAALEVGFAQCCLAGLAWLRSRSLIPNPAPAAPLLDWAGGLLNPLGSDAGGMSVRVGGRDALGKPIHAAWHIHAAGGHGPEIPCMASILLARKLIRGESLPVGAMPAVGVLTLAEFAPEFERWGMDVDICHELGC